MRSMDKKTGQYSALGLASGIGTTLGLLPHVLVLGTLLLIGVPPRSVASLLVFTIGAKLLGEWFFWSRWKGGMDSEPKLKNWRLTINESLLSHPNVVIGLVMMLLDSCIDAVLVSIALKTSIPPI